MFLLLSQLRQLRQHMSATVITPSDGTAEGEDRSSKELSKRGGSLDHN